VIVAHSAVNPSVSASAVISELDSAPTRKRRRSNRRVAIRGRAPLVAVADGVGAVGRVIALVARWMFKVLLLAGLLATLIGGGRLAVAHVMGSQRFALREVVVSATSRLSHDEVLALAQVNEGDRLLALDTDAIARRVAEHPWVAEARVRRQLPSALTIDVVERKAVAVAVLGALYLLDDGGRPFKRATPAEAVGLPVITGLERSQYVDHRGPSEAAYREALAVVAAWGRQPAGSGSARPALGEVNLSPRYGFTLYLLEGGAEVRLGRGDYDRKLASLDQIFEAVRTSGQPGSAIRGVYLDGDDPGKVTARLQLPADPAGSAPAGEQTTVFSTTTAPTTAASKPSRTTSRTSSPSLSSRSATVSE
jgi:cell division protein FtsQ